MADKKSDKYPHKWPDGTYHSVPWTSTKQYEATRNVADPPAGYYDPNLDAQLKASQRNYESKIEDVGTGRERGATDLGTLLTNIGLQKGRASEDYATGQKTIETGYQRNLSDLLKAREQGTADYGTQVGELQRGYQQLGTAQGEQQRKAGAFAGSGAAIQAAQKRAANEQHDRNPIDTAYARFMDQSGTTQNRLVEDKTGSLDDLLRSYQRVGQDIDRGGGQSLLDYQRGGEDLTTTERRAGDEYEAFKQDVKNAKVAQYMDITGGTKLGDLTVAPPTKGLSVTPVGSSTLVANKKKRKGNVVTYYNTPKGP